MPAGCLPSMPGSTPLRPRACHSDRARYAIVRGRIKPTLDTRAGSKRVTGYIEGLDVSWRNVSRQFHPALATRNESFTPGVATRYAVTAAFGRRFESWVLAVAALFGKPQ